MRIEKKWHVGLMVFLVISLIASSVFLTLSVLNWNLRKAQLDTERGDVLFENDSLSKHPYSLLQELAKGQIQKNDFPKTDLIAAEVVAQLLSTMRPNDFPRYSTDTILGIHHALRSISIIDPRSQELKAELNTNPAPHRRQEILDELNRIFAKATTRVGFDRITKYQ